MRVWKSSRLGALGQDQRGVALVEFAFVAPVMCLFLVGAFDLSHTLYMRSVLQGALQKAARDTALESGNSPAQQAIVDGRVRSTVRKINGSLTDADIKISRRFYRTFDDAGAKRPEDYQETNGNMICDKGELFDDVNGNGMRDADGGDAGQGGAKDSVLYTVQLQYRRLLPLHGFINVSPEVKVNASTILKNQPYAEQGVYGARRQGKCT